MNNLNVFKYSLRSRYYLLHPWKFLTETWYNLRAAWSRATKGYCATDVWNLSDWLLEVLPPMFRKMADDGCGYSMDTPEQWEDWLHSVADVLESLQEDNWETRNEFAEDFHRVSERARHSYRDEDGNLRITWNDDAEYKEISELWRIREEELHKEWKELAADTGFEIFSNLEKLWD